MTEPAEGPTGTEGEAQADQIVHFGGRIPASLRRRVKVAAAQQDMGTAQVLIEALEEYLARRGL